MDEGGTYAMEDTDSMAIVATKGGAGKRRMFGNQQLDELHSYVERSSARLSSSASVAALIRTISER
jgi:hypothetical protein